MRNAGPVAPSVAAVLKVCVDGGRGSVKPLIHRGCPAMSYLCSQIKCSVIRGCDLCACHGERVCTHSRAVDVLAMYSWAAKETRGTVPGLANT